MTYFSRVVAKDTVAMVNPAFRFAADQLIQAADVMEPYNPLLAHWWRIGAANAEIGHRLTRRYEKGPWALGAEEATGRKFDLIDQPVDGLVMPEGTVVEFVEESDKAKNKSPVLTVAPISGHYATLLRGTISALALDHRTFITDWNDARNIPEKMGRLDDNAYVRSIIKSIRGLTEKTGRRIHLVAVCQPSPLVMVALALMYMAGDHRVPMSVSFINGPLDPRKNPTSVNHLAQMMSMAWFEANTEPVSGQFPGRSRMVYPGDRQIERFIAMNLDRHMAAHVDMHRAVVNKDAATLAKLRSQYDEFLTGMDMPAEFYLQTILKVFKNFDLPKGTWDYTSENNGVVRIDTRAIGDKTGIMTVECHEDDICGEGQTYAAHRLTPNAALHRHLGLPEGGHAAGYTGSKFRELIRPSMTRFMKDCEHLAAA
jgi:poly(3-hydroxybutyrate) depolymerase